MERAPLPKISLFCTKDGSDKEYHAEIKEVEGGYIVQTRFGKRGAAKEPKAAPAVLTFTEAVAEFEAIVKEKKSPKKGYTEDVGGVAYASSELAGKMSGNLPHLLVPITYERLLELVQDDDYGFMEKIDGERLMVDRQAATVVTSNKLGVINSVPAPIVTDISSINAADILADGENRQGQMHIFDILRLNGQCLKALPTIERYQIYSALEVGPSLVKVPMHLGKDAKQAFLDYAQSQNNTTLVEGIVVKLLSAPYLPGRAAPTQATHFKYKFVEDASCIVLSTHKSKRSVRIGLLDENGNLREVGNVGIPAKYDMPAENDVIDVQYRHLYSGGDFCEPVFLKARNDVLASECLITQVTRIKEKSASDVDED